MINIYEEWKVTKFSDHPEIQERLRKEITKNSKASNGEIYYENLYEMTYLNQVVNGKNAVRACFINGPQSYQWLYDSRFQTH